MVEKEFSEINVCQLISTGVSFVARQEKPLGFKLSDLGDRADGGDAAPRRAVNGRAAAPADVLCRDRGFLARFVLTFE